MPQESAMVSVAFSCLLLWINSCIVEAQQESWTNQFGTSELENVYALATLGDDIVVAGFTAGSLDGNSNAGFWDIFVTKLDSSGSKIWTFQIGSASTEVARAVQIESSTGNIVVVGYTWGTQFGANAGRTDIFVVKIDNVGSHMWAMQTGSADDDDLHAVQIDSSGNIIVGGETRAALPGFSNSNPGTRDIIVLKLDSSGSIQWTKQTGSASDEYVYDLKLDASNDIVLAGTTWGQLGSSSNAGGSDIYVMKLNNAGSSQWVFQTGTTGSDEGKHLGIDSSGNILVGGWTSGDLGNTNQGSTDIVVMQLDSAGTLQWTFQTGTEGVDYIKGLAIGTFNIILGGTTTSAWHGSCNRGGEDLFIMELDSDGSSVQKIFQTGSSSADTLEGLVLNADEAVILAGYSYGDLGGSNAGSGDAFVMKVQQLSWTFQTGTSGADGVNALQIDSSGNIFLTGETNGALDGSVSSGDSDLFVMKLDSTGSRQWTYQTGSTAQDTAEAIHLAASGSIFVAGWTAGDLSGASAGNFDILVMKLDDTGSQQWTYQTGTASADYAFAVETDASGNILLAGSTDGSMQGSNAGDSDIFVMQLDSAGSHQWTVQIGSNLKDVATALRIDASGDLVLAGYTTGDLGNTNAGSKDIFAMKLSSAGSQLWTLQRGSSADDSATALEIDSYGDLILAGWTAGSLDGNSNAGSVDLFAMKVDAQGSWEWTFQTGTAREEWAGSLQIIPSGHILLAGSIKNGLGGSEDILAVELDSAGSLQWKFVAGTTAGDIARAVQLDASNNVILAGTTGGGFNGNAHAGSDDIFVMKVLRVPDPAPATSGQVSWTFQTGTSVDDVLLGAVLDSCGNVILAGDTKGSLGGSNAGNSNWDIFAVKLSEDGSEVWAYQTGSDQHDQVLGLAVDSFNSIVLTGHTSGSLNSQSHSGQTDIFVMKIDRFKTLQWTYQTGQSSLQEGTGVQVDLWGNIFVAGWTEGDLHSQVSAGDVDAFVMKLSSDGVNQWTVLSGGSAGDYAVNLAMDASGNIVVVGYSYGSFQSNSHAGGSDLFVWKLNHAGSDQWSFQAGTSGDEWFAGVDIDSAGNIVVTGNTDGVMGGSSAGSQDVVVLMLDSLGVQQWILQTGTSTSDTGMAAVWDPSGSIFVMATALDSLAGGVAIGDKDVVLLKLGATGNQEWVSQLGTSAKEECMHQLSLGAAGNILVAGSTTGAITGSNAGGEAIFAMMVLTPTTTTSSTLTVSTTSESRTSTMSSTATSITSTISSVSSTTTTSTTSTSSTSFTTTTSTTSTSTSTSSSSTSTSSTSRTTSTSTSTSSSSTGTSSTSFTTTTTITNTSTSTSSSSTGTSSTSFTTTSRTISTSTSSSSTGTSTSSSSTGTSSTSFTTTSRTISTSTSSSSAGTSSTSSTLSTASGSGTTSSGTSKFGTTSSATLSGLSTSMSETSTVSWTSSSTSTSSVEAGSFADTLRQLEQSTEALLRQLSDTNGTGQNILRIVSETSIGKVSVMRLQEPNSSVDGEYVQLVDETSGTVLPLEVLQNDEVLVATSFSENQNAIIFQGTSRTLLKPVTGVVDVSIYDVYGLDNWTAKKVVSTRPIYVKLGPLTEPFDATRWTCAYLDGDTWSTDGVRLVTAEELEAFNLSASGAWCVSYHLSIFAGFLDLLLDCTNINVLSEENLQEILKPRWWSRPPALFLWPSMALLLALIVLGIFLDASVRRSGLWKDEYFLTEVPPVRGSCGSCGSCTARRSDASEAPKKPSASTVPALHHEPSVASLARFHQADLARIQKKLHRVMNPAISSRIQDDSIWRNTLRYVALQHKLHIESLEMHVWGRNGWVQGSLAVEKSPVLKSLVMRLEGDLPEAFVLMHSSRLHRVCSTFLAAHPAYTLLHCDLHVTAAKRGKIFMDCILGSLAFVAIFFSVDGSAVAARSPADCPVQQGTFLWYTFVTLFSILLNFIPRSLLFHLAWRDFEQRDRAHRRRQLRKRLWWDIQFWAVAVGLSCLHVLVITAFLANLGEADEWKWMLSFTVVLLRKLIIVPVVSCIFSGLVSEVTAFAQPALLSDPPRKFGLDLSLRSSSTSNLGSTGSTESLESLEPGVSTTWENKVKELAQRGITVRQLLDFYADLEQQMSHFDPDQSTTHDVVRQVVIPGSLQMRGSRHYQIVVQCEHFEPLQTAICSVRAVNGSCTKPWKGGDSVRPKEPSWEAVFLLQDINQEAIRISLELEQTVCEAVLPNSSFQSGFEGDIQLGATSLHVRIVRIHSLEDLQDAETVAKTVSHASSHGSQSVAAGAFHKAMNESSSVQILPKKPFEIASRAYFKLPDVPGGEPARGYAGRGFAYATAVNRGVPMLAYKMVTHNWGNKFTHLIGAIFADALQEETYDGVVTLLKNKDFDRLHQQLDERNQLSVPYWVCAFSVNQHAEICARAPTADSTGHPITTCSCKTQKHFEGDFSEMNKFDDMMNYLKRQLREVYSEVRLEQVVAMDVNFTLLTRVWCVAELVEADHLHISQAVKIHSGASRDVCLGRLASSDVRQAEASFPADKELVLGKIENVEAFNKRLQDLMLHRLDSFLGKHSATASTLCDEILGAALTVAM